VERLKERDDMIGLRLDGMKKFKALKLVQFFPNFLLDEFFFRVGGFIHGENMKRHLVLSVSIANECDTVATHNDLQFHLMNKHSQLSVATSTLPFASSRVAGRMMVVITGVIGRVLGVQRLHTGVS